MLNRKGFTLIELVMIIVILGILAAVAMPKYLDLQDEAKVAGCKGAVGGLRSAISIWYANNAASGSTAWPAVSDITTMMQHGVPENPYNNSTAITTSATKATNAGNYGWVYNTTSGEIWGNTTDSSSY